MSSTAYHYTRFLLTVAVATTVASSAAEARSAGPMLCRLDHLAHGDSVAGLWVRTRACGARGRGAQGNAAYKQILKRFPRLWHLHARLLLSSGFGATVALTLIALPWRFSTQNMSQCQGAY